MDKNTMIGVDLAKNIFQLHIATMTGKVLSKKKLSRDRFKEFMKSHEPAIVVLEACGSAHYWAEMLADMGHDVKLIAPQYVKPFVKRQKNDAADADIDYKTSRGLDRTLFQKLTQGDWIDAHDNVALIGPSGVGKSWLACAIGQKACRDNRAVLYHRWPRLCEEFALTRGDGRYARTLKSLGRTELLILDDFGLEPLDTAARHDLLEILEERYGRRSTIITSQLPIPSWHVVIGDPTYADAIMDRFIHNAHRIELSGESMRRTKTKQPKSA